MRQPCNSSVTKVTHVETTARVMLETDRSSSKLKCNLKCNMAHGVYAVVLLCILCVVLIVGVAPAPCFMIDVCVVMFANVLIPIIVVSSCLLPSQRVENEKIAHFQLDQRQQLCHLLDEFAERFDDLPVRCDAVVHQIQTTDGLVPRQMRPYRVPDAFKPEVDRQIHYLLDKGLIRPSNSPMAIPIVCVAKRNGGVRIACDLNLCTVDAFDAKSASSQPVIWQIPLAEEHRWLTAFVTHDSFYEWL